MEGLLSPANFHFPFWQSFFEGWDATKKKDKVKGGRQEPLPACESWGRAWVWGSGWEGLEGGRTASVSHLLRVYPVPSHVLSITRVISLLPLNLMKWDIL